MRDVEIDEAESNKLLLRRKADNVHSALLRRAYFCFRPLSGDLGLLFRDFRPGAGGEAAPAPLPVPTLPAAPTCSPSDRTASPSPLWQASEATADWKFYNAIFSCGTFARKSASSRLW